VIIEYLMKVYPFQAMAEIIKFFNCPVMEMVIVPSTKVSLMECTFEIRKQR